MVRQPDHWYIAPMEIEMISTSPTPLLISPTIGTNVPGTVLKAGNGYYNSAGDLLFYIAVGNIYDYHNTIMSPIRGGGTEIIVLPFETNNNCQSKYSVFITTGGFTSASSLWQYIVDIKSMTVTEVYVDQISYNGSPSTEYGAIALSKNPNPASSNDRYLYFLAGPGTIGAANGGQINKIIIHNNGTFTLAGKIYPTILNPNSNAGAEIFAQELDISPDGRRLAWGSFAAAPSQLRYHMIELNSTGDYVNNSYVQFNNPGISGNNVSGFRGIEFYGTGSNTKLFVGEGTSGIHSINIPLVNTPPLATDFKFVSNSVGYGNSQIEYARNSLMYASSSSQPLNHWHLIHQYLTLQ
ncbi:MAG: hypothetical protein IPK08_19265 [Bacteroidetes bacterium]|nr:hypothetical protein [Bacteroidota bacterium]